MSQIGNGMAIYDEPPEQTFHTCPVCGADWLEVRNPEDPIWGVTYEYDGISTEEWPISKRGCVYCAIGSATVEDMIRYIEENGLETDFVHYLSDETYSYKPAKINPDSTIAFAWNMAKHMMSQKCIELPFLPDYLWDKQIRRDFGEWMLAQG